MINSTNIGTWVDAAISQGDCLVRGRFAEDFVRSQRGALGRVLKLAHRVAAPVGTGGGVGLSARRVWTPSTRSSSATSAPNPRPRPSSVGGAHDTASRYHHCSDLLARVDQFSPPPIATDNNNNNKQICIAPVSSKKSLSASVAK